MKTRMGVSRCCCAADDEGTDPADQCAPGETEWSDDFLSYTPGESSSQYGYSGNCGTPTLGLGYIEPGGVFGCSFQRIVMRGFPHNYSSPAALEYEAEMLTATSIFAPFGVFLLGRIQNEVYNGAFIGHQGGTLRTISVGADGTTQQTSLPDSFTVGDTLGIKIEPVGFVEYTVNEPNDSIDLTALITYKKNGAQVHQETGHVFREKPDWCSNIYGASGRSTNWVFSIA